MSTTIESQSSLTDALSIEISILRSVVKRNYHAHHRTKYFRFVKMALLHLDRHSIIHLEEIVSFIQMYRLDYLTKKSNSNSDKMNLQEIQEYTLVENPKTIVNVPMNDQKNTNMPMLQKLCHSLQWLNHCMLHTLPEAIRRIEDACNIIIEENISKGYYLSLCCIIVASFARVRSILLHLGRNTIHEFLMYVECVGKDKKIKLTDGNNKCMDNITKTFCRLPKKFIEAFMEKQSNESPDERQQENGSTTKTMDSLSTLLQEDIGESLHSNNIMSPSKSSNDNCIKRKKPPSSKPKKKHKIKSRYKPKVTTSNGNINKMNNADSKKTKGKIKNGTNRNGIVKKEQNEKNTNNSNSLENTTKQPKKRKEIELSNGSGSGSYSSVSKSKKKKKKKKATTDSTLDDIFKA